MSVEVLKQLLEIGSLQPTALVFSPGLESGIPIQLLLEPKPQPSEARSMPVAPIVTVRGSHALADGLGIGAICVAALSGLMFLGALAGMAEAAEVRSETSLWEAFTTTKLQNAKDTEESAVGILVGSGFFALLGGALGLASVVRAVRVPGMVGLATNLLVLGALFLLALAAAFAS